MRDLLIIIIILGGSAVALRKPWIGIILWTWVSLMNPHQQWGYISTTMPIAMIVGASTLIGFLFSREKLPIFTSSAAWVLAAFAVWITFTLPFSMYFDKSLPLWERTIKTYLMLFVTLALIESPRKMNIYIWTMVVSIGFYGVKGGLFTLLTGGNYRVWGPGGFIEGNNEIGLAVILVIPLMHYLQLQMTNKWYRHLMTVSMVLSALMALGTHSRGALLALLAMAFLIWVRGQRKLAFGFMAIAIGLLILPFMPAEWWARMDTIQTYDQDASALGRINAWWMAWNLAKDRLLGGGFDIYNATVFSLYAPDPHDVHAAHSIYFQILGEHGFIGLALFLLLGVVTWITAGKLMKIGKSDASLGWARDLGAMAQASMVGYAVGGAFLSLAYFDLPYNIMVAVILAKHFAEQKSSQTQVSDQHESIAKQING
ncbi:putative O-glycosylation ligase, exosortase A system-associated [Azonexus sp.]|jgi:probable O-glycosylation ligase (exosortase A-associated)|uniref:putative O-glycosylation ligase, exosortase A system-associated n=1 Tax=Azonexus sp. TaxID=1872668 RepID=UPI0028309E0D|nr:putative O-glycosylation ligase, exosortase A system-associated [Azonexus sp.]MDR1996230.1 putative O-glycosylation ligase, exosortase A system-associated [Azonexus sp.]